MKLLPVEPDHLAQHWGKFSDKGSIGESLYNFGWGDGGGGPDPEMLEYLKRYQDFPGVTPAKPNLIERALESLHQKALQTTLPIWNDELCLEEHRGTFTTKARLKKLNRTCEILYREAELFSCFSGMPYPSENLTRGWKKVLNNQFHDSLPGSHSPAVYLDLLDSYDIAIQIGDQTRQEALSALEKQIDTRGDGQALIVFNSLSFERNSILQLPMQESPLRILDPAGDEVPHQFMRSAYRNHSFDEAKFEVPGHWWMDLSQPDCGLSLLNNCKYGHEAFDGMMALTLLRSPTNPDPQSDQEEQWFTYSLLPHAGTWRTGKTHQVAADLNVPCLPVVADSHPGTLPPRHSFLSLDTDNVTLEALKKAENSDHLVLRLVERWGVRNRVLVTLRSTLEDLRECYLLEREDLPMSFNGRGFQFEIGPYEIRSFKIRLAKL